MARMTSWEFTESLAFEHLEPDPADESARLLGLLVMMYANQHRDARSHPTPYTFDDFVPNPYGPTKAERQAGFAAVMAGYAQHSKHRKPD